MAARTRSKNGPEHRFSQENLSAYIDQQLSASERARVERHLQACEPCREELAALRHTTALISQAPRVHAPRSFALPRSMQPIQASQRRWEGLFAFARTAAVIASALMIVFLAGDVALTLRWASTGAMPSAQPETFKMTTVVVELGTEEEPMVALQSAPLPAETATEQWAEPERALAAPPEVVKGTVKETAVAEAEAEMEAMSAPPTLSEGQGAGEVTSMALPSEAPAEKVWGEFPPATPGTADTAQTPATEEPVVAMVSSTQAPPTEVPTPPPPTEQPTPLPPTPEPLPGLTGARDQELAAASEPRPTKAAEDYGMAVVQPQWRLWGWLRTIWMLMAGLVLILLGALVWANYHKRF